MPDTYRPDPRDVLRGAWDAASDLMGRQWPVTPGPLPRGRPTKKLPRLDAYEPEPTFMQTHGPKVPEAGEAFKEVVTSMAPGLGLGLTATGKAARGALRTQLGSGAAPPMRDIDVMPARQGEDMPMTHYGNVEGLDELDPAKFGTGMPAQEAGRLSAAPDLQNRTYAYLKADQVPESGVGPHRYDFEATNSYDLEADPQGYGKLAQRLLTEEDRVYNQARLVEGKYPIANPVSHERHANMTERLVREAGYEGHHAPQAGVGVRYDATPLGRGATQEEALGHHIAAGSKVGTGAQRVQRREASTGRMVGAPPGVEQGGSPLGHMRRKLKKRALGGVLGRMWYERSGQTISEGFSGAEAPTKGMAGALAITSPSTNVSTNTNFALMAQNQAAAGRPLSAGMYPAPMSPRLQDVLVEGVPLSGRKVPSFYGNILHKMFPDIPQGVTADMWMARAFGYKKDKLSPEQYNFVERETERVAEELNRTLPAGETPWDKKQVQAAIWTQMKHEKEGIPLERAAESFREGVLSRRADLPQESAPGATSGVMPWMAEATPAQKQLWHDNLNKRVLTDDYGNNIVAREMGALQVPGVEGTGVYEGAFSPVRSSGVAVARSPARDAQQAAVNEGLGSWVKDTDKWGKPVDKFKLKPGATDEQRAVANWHADKVDPASRDLMTSAVATQAKVTKQDAGAWVRLFSDRKVPKHSQDAATLHLELTPDQVRDLEGILARTTGKNTSPYPVVRIGDGYAVINPGKPGKKTSGFENADFQAHVKAALADDAMPDIPKLSWSGHDGEYFPNDWLVNPNGEAYDKVIQGTGETLSGKSAKVQELLQPRYDEQVRYWEQNLGP